MIKFYCLVLLLLLIKIASAHNPQVSTISILQDKNKKMSVLITAPLYTFQMAMKINDPGLDLEKVDPITMQREISKLVKNNFILNKDERLKLAEEKIQIAHETTLYYTISGTNKNFNFKSLSFSAFDKLKDHFTLLKIIPDQDKEINFILSADNKYFYVADEGETNLPDKRSIFIALISALVFSVILILFLSFKKINIMRFKLLIIPFLLCFFFSCSKSSEPSTNNTTTNVTSIVPEVYKKIYGATSITSDGTYIIIKTKDLPDHKSPYYPVGNPLYEAYTGTTFGGYNFVKNPNSIVEQSGTIKIPLNPKVDETHPTTPLGPIGIAINGVAFFNQYAGPSQPLTNEIVSFDKYYGHPQQSGVYHYHVEPLYLTTIKSSKSGLLGFLLDGFPVYGPQDEDGTVITNSLLDAFHGHSHKTIDYPNGIYHYHFTNEAPYLNGSGFYGKPGTITQ